MKKIKFLTISVLPIMWTAYFLFEIFTGRVTDANTILGNIALIILFAIVGYLIYILSQRYPNGLLYNSILKLFLLLMLIDQGIKIIIKYFFFNNYFEVIAGFLSFNPIINTDGSWLNARFGTNVSFTFLIALNICALFLFLEIYRYRISKSNHDFWTDMCFLFTFSGGLCSLIDKIFYGGSLDFIGISNLFIADIKDLYINIGILFFVIAIYDSDYLISDENSSLKDDIECIKRFLRFVKTDFKSLFQK